MIKLEPHQPIPDVVSSQDWFSVTRTQDELSIVCPTSAAHHLNRKEAEHGWRCIQVSGVLDFGLTGILYALTKPLAERKIPVFAVSTYNTDYLLVKEEQLENARDVLVLAGYTFQ
ncbi:ACT domain-containing protein [Paenibacillus daejeonensis]|uniref:ACT domain-containing protein n=1 Tax=Paenibacillus daejeonensis TaxID=135193 RepID=UPI001FE24239|nr:ACT domain-containing protein [Paenibacillus daejeonensis]